jgi:hypothetical protein
MRSVLLRNRSRVLLGLLLTLSAGCNMIGAMTNKMAGEQKTPAAYKLAKTSTLVFVESYQNPDLFNVQSQQLSANVIAILTDNKVAPVVPTAKLDELRAKDPAAFARMDIPSIARAVEAKQVIYVNLVQFKTDFPIGGTQFSGQCEARVKLFDTETGRVLWPPDSSEGRQIQYESKPEEDVDPRNLNAVQDQMCHHMAARISELFYDAVPDEPDTSGP